MKKNNLFDKIAENLQDGWSEISFDNVLKWLGIFDYKDKIYTFNENGDLLHCYTYMVFAKTLKKSGYDGESFREWFLLMEEWFQKDEEYDVRYIYWHAPKFFMSYIKEFKNETS